MKEAAGEANMTVITIVLIGVVAAIGAVIIPNITRNMDKKACCQQNGGYWFNGGCYSRANCNLNTNGVVTSCTGTTISTSC